MMIAIAMAAGGGGAGGGAPQSGIVSFIPLILIFVIFYFLLIRPQQKKAKEREALLKSIKKGDKVITSSGIHGTIAGLDDATVLLDIGNNTKIKMERSAVGQVVASKES